MYSRRDFGKIALVGWPLAAALAKINSTIDGVRLGVQTYLYTGQSIWSTAFSASDLESNGLAGIDVINWFQSVHAHVSQAIQVC